MSKRTKPAIDTCDAFLEELDDLDFEAEVIPLFDGGISLWLAELGMSFTIYPNGKMTGQDEQRRDVEGFDECVDIVVKALDTE